MDAPTAAVWAMMGLVSGSPTATSSLTESQCTTMMQDLPKHSSEDYARCYGPDGKVLGRDKDQADDSTEADPKAMKSTEADEPPRVTRYGLSQEQYDFNRFIKGRDVHVFMHDKRRP